MKLSLNKNIRTRAREVSDEIQKVEAEISREVRTKYKPLTQALRLERQRLWDCEKELIEQVSILFKNGTVQLGTKVEVTVQVGPNGGDILRTHTGTIEKIYDKWKPCFDLSDKNYLDGKKFTIGSSCIQSFEVLK